MMIKDKLQKDLEKLVESSNLSLAGKVTVEHPADSTRGDYSTNIAMRAVKGKEMFPQPSPPFATYDDPMAIAEKLIKIWEKPNYIDKVDIVKPGFINFWLSQKALFEELKTVQKEDYGSLKEGKGKTVVVEYSSPNIAKQFGIGHLRSTIIGQAIYNLYKFQGFKTIGDNHLGDWGTQFGIVLYQVISKKLNPEKLSIDELENLYIEFHQAAQGDPELMDKAREWFKRLEDGDRIARKIWKTLSEKSLAEFERIYELLGVKIDNAHGESFYEDKMPAVIAEARKIGLAKQDQGALVIKVPRIETPLILLKSDGATTYGTRDLATIKWRVKTWKPTKIIYEVGAEQTLYFNQVFGSARLFEWGRVAELVHVKHGLYLSPTGTKFATRKGETVKLEDVLEEAIKRAKKIIDKSETHLRQGFGGQASRGLTKKEKDKVARAVGIGAVKYFDLSHQPASDIVFDWENIFLLEGNSAPYLQYTYARTQSVIKKSNIKYQISKIQGKMESARLPDGQGKWKINAEELAALRHFYKFPEVVQDAAAQFSPNLVCNFLFDLAQKYNALYNQHKIIGNPFRLALNAITGNILQSGLSLLGIEAPNKM